VRLRGLRRGRLARPRRRQLRRYDPSVPCGQASGQREFCHAPVRRERHAPFPTAAGERGALRMGWVRGRHGRRRATRRRPGPGLGVFCADFARRRGLAELFVATTPSPTTCGSTRKGRHHSSEEGRPPRTSPATSGASRRRHRASHGATSDETAWRRLRTHLTEGATPCGWRGPRGLVQDGTDRAGLAPPVAQDGIREASSIRQRRWIDLAVV